MFAGLMMLVSLVMLSSSVMLAPLRTMAELTMVTIRPVVSIVIVVIRVVIITVTTVSRCTASQHETHEKSYPPKDDLFSIHSNHFLSTYKFKHPILEIQRQRRFPKGILEEGEIQGLFRRA